MTARPAQVDGGRRARWTVGWGFGAACDLSCPFCYSRDVRRRLDPRQEDLAGARRFLARNGPAIRAINFGTGELFLAPSCVALLELCAEQAPRASIAVTTNGALAALPASALAAVQRTVAECDVSLDFADERQHDSWRGRPGTWRRALDAVGIARQLGLQTSVVLVGTGETLARGNLDRLLELAAALEVAVRVNLYMPTNGDRRFIPSRPQVMTALRRLERWSSALLTSDRLLERRTWARLPRSCRLLPDGTVSPCTYLTRGPWASRAPIAELELEPLLRRPSFRLYADPPTPAACAPCPARDSCRGGSVERRWLWAGSLAEPDPLCGRAAGDDHDRPAGRGDPPGDAWNGPWIHLEYLPTIVALPPRVTAAAAVGGPRGDG